VNALVNVLVVVFAVLTLEPLLTFQQLIEEEYKATKQTS